MWIPRELGCKDVWDSPWLESVPAVSAHTHCLRSQKTPKHNCSPSPSLLWEKTQDINDEKQHENKKTPHALFILSSECGKKRTEDFFWVPSGGLFICTIRIIQKVRVALSWSETGRSDCPYSNWSRRTAWQMRWWTLDGPCRNTSPQNWVVFVIKPYDCCDRKIYKSRYGLLLSSTVNVWMFLFLLRRNVHRLPPFYMAGAPAHGFYMSYRF